MIKRINNYLLTHNPLLWNTRIVWVALANVILHLLFYVAGLLSISAQNIGGYYSVRNAVSENVYTFSVLCSLLVLIIWCLYYLRNNAFKNFYKLPRHHLAKEAFLIFIIILSSISYFNSFEAGVKTKGRSLTSEAVLQGEIAAINTAMVYLPVDAQTYFILNTCEAKTLRGDSLPYEINESYPPSDIPGNLDTALVAKARLRPDAFSFANYCKLFITTDAYAIPNREAVSLRNRRWLRGHHTDSVRQAIAAFISILNKYGIDYRLPADAITAAVFSDSVFSQRTEIPQSRFRDTDGQPIENPVYVTSSMAEQAMSFLLECYGHRGANKDDRDEWTAIGYVALCFSILLLCYRRFSKRVFLISVVGSIVWAILVGLLAMSIREEELLSSFVLILYAVFLFIALVSMARQQNKTAAGAFLNWHLYLTPFVLPLVFALVKEYHNNMERLYTRGSYATGVSEAYMQQHYPVSTWIVAHDSELAILNIILVLLYVAFVFNQLAKRWALLPEE